jgi:hypothetical protein
LYEFPEYRRTVASFLARALGGPLSPDQAGDLAAATDALRMPDAARPPTTVESEPGGFRSLARIAGPLPRRRKGSSVAGATPANAAMPADDGPSQRIAALREIGS